MDNVKKARLAFVLPEDNRSGGVRVTMQLGNALIERSWNVDIVVLNRNGIRQVVKRVLKRAGKKKGWLSDFHGAVRHSRQVATPLQNEYDCVVAVGSYVLPYVPKCGSKAIRIAYCHGLSESIPELMTRWHKWDGPIITTNKPLASRITDVFGKWPDAVVENGISKKDYFPAEGVERTSVGTIWSSHCNKSPEVIRAVMEGIAARRPDIPLVMFGTQPDPGIATCRYFRSPSIQEARSIYSMCRVWCVCSRDEGFCLPVVEAMRCGCVVVSTRNIGSLGIIRNSKYGVLVDVGDVDGLIAETVAMWDNNVRRDAIAGRAKECTDKYTWTSSAEAFEAAIELIRKKYGE